MISQILYGLERGWQQLISNNKLLFIGIILFVFPLLFIAVLEQFYTVAAANIETADQSRISSLHDAVVAVFESGAADISPTLSRLAERNSDIEKFRIYEVIDETNVQITASLNQDEVGETVSSVSTLRTSQITPGETFNVQLQNETGRIVQAVRLLPGTPEQYVFSEHARGSFDLLLSQRKLDAYLLLSVIFVFLIALAYWVNRQTDWKQRHARIEKTLKERDLFSNMIAHEFRTPLTAIKGYASFLQDSKTLSADDHRFADTIRESAERLVLLVNDFLEVARIQSGRMQLEVATVDLCSVIVTVIDTTKQAAADKQLQLHFEQPNQPISVTTDENRLTQVLTNIISNSIKYTASGSVTVSCVESKSDLIIRVQDTGMGISAADQQKLFSPFSRVGGVEQTATTGTGLGMWITKQLVELLGGVITLESIKDVGTRVDITFPKKR